MEKYACKNIQPCPAGVSRLKLFTKSSFPFQSFHKRGQLPTVENKVWVTVAVER